MSISVEIGIAVLIAFLSAAAGGYLGYHFGRVRDDRLRTVDFAIGLLEETFTIKRMRFLNTLKKLNEADLQTAANTNVGEFEPFRRDCFEIFNRYELICLLKTKGDLDTKIFADQILPIIRSDYEVADGFFEQVALHQERIGGDVGRPFYEHIALIAPRRRQPNETSKKGAER